MLINLEHIEWKDQQNREHYCHPDQVSLLIVLNHLFKKHPQLFGNETQQKALAEECNSPPYLQEGYLHVQHLLCNMPSLFKKHGINPLADIDVIFVAPAKLALSERLIGKFLKSFKDFHIIPEEDAHLDTHNAYTLANGKKADFVITGNVLNAHENNQQEDCMRACAMMLKKDGTAIHMLSYGESLTPNKASLIDSPGVHKSCGQTHLDNIPPSPYD